MLRTATGRRTSGASEILHVSCRLCDNQRFWFFPSRLNFISIAHQSAGKIFDIKSPTGLNHSTTWWKLQESHRETGWKKFTHQLWCGRVCKWSKCLLGACRRVSLSRLANWKRVSSSRRFAFRALDGYPFSPITSKLFFLEHKFLLFHEGCRIFSKSIVNLFTLIFVVWLSTSSPHQVLKHLNLHSFLD